MLINDLTAQLQLLSQQIAAATKAGADVEVARFAASQTEVSDKLGKANARLASLLLD